MCAKVAVGSRILPTAFVSGVKLMVRSGFYRRRVMVNCEDSESGLCGWDILPICGLQFWFCTLGFAVYYVQVNIYSLECVYGREKLIARLKWP